MAQAENFLITHNLAGFAAKKHSQDPDSDPTLEASEKTWGESDWPNITGQHFNFLL